MSSPHPEVCAWISRPGWGVAHVLRPASLYHFRCAEYARTQCGRNVRYDLVTVAEYEDRCKRCTNITDRLRDEARASEA